PSEANRETLRLIQISAECIVKRSFGQSRKRRWTENVAVNEAVSTEELQRIRYDVIDARIKLINPRPRDRSGGIDVRSRHVGIRNQWNDFRCHRIPTIFRNDPQTIRVPRKFRTSRSKRIEDRR